ncbi:hypothetical protein E2C01_075111 [Portunus trituberculatus]|uniref:Uncharacterized protein n=1 Tax=Portunus trituberculatus TaxID=210409 RepID=A0A5B7I591_PORTR|nr:hypothetical protein [Portunus trituberculatus]
MRWEEWAGPQLRNAGVTTRDRPSATRYRYPGDECDAAVTFLCRPGQHNGSDAANPWPNLLLPTSVESRVWWVYFSPP